MTSRLPIGLRKKFEAIYDTHIVRGGFFESEEYYRQERERYWRCLQFLSELEIPRPAKILDIGGGQLAVLCTLLFGDRCYVADVAEHNTSHLRSLGIEFFELDLLHRTRSHAPSPAFDVCFLLEVIEHIPLFAVSTSETN